MVQHKLQRPVIARHVRVIPLDWNPNGQIGLRLETYGCPYGQLCLFYLTSTGINMILLTRKKNKGYAIKFMRFVQTAVSGRSQLTVIVSEEVSPDLCCYRLGCDELRWPQQPPLQVEADPRDQSAHLCDVQGSEELWDAALRRGVE